MKHEIGKMEQNKDKKTITNKSQKKNIKINFYYLFFLLFVCVCVRMIDIGKAMGEHTCIMYLYIHHGSVNLSTSTHLTFAHRIFT